MCAVAQHATRPAQPVAAPLLGGGRPERAAARCTRALGVADQRLASARSARCHPRPSSRGWYRYWYSSTVGCVGRRDAVLAGVGGSEKKKAKGKSGWLVRSAPRSAIFVGASARFVVGRGDRLVGDSIRAPHWRSCIPGGRRIAPISVRCWPCTQVPLPTGRGGPWRRRPNRRSDGHEWSEMHDGHAAATVELPS